MSMARQVRDRTFVGRHPEQATTTLDRTSEALATGRLRKGGPMASILGPYGRFGSQSNPLRN